MNSQLTSISSESVIGQKSRAKKETQEDEMFERMEETLKKLVTIYGRLKSSSRTGMLDRRIMQEDVIEGADKLLRTIMLKFDLNDTNIINNMFPLLGSKLADEPKKIQTQLQNTYSKRSNFVSQKEKEIARQILIKKKSIAAKKFISIKNQMNRKHYQNNNTYGDASYFNGLKTHKYALRPGGEDSRYGVMNIEQVYLDTGSSDGQSRKSTKKLIRSVSEIQTGSNFYANKYDNIQNHRSLENKLYNINSDPNNSRYNSMYINFDNADGTRNGGHSSYDNNRDSSVCKNELTKLENLTIQKLKSLEDNNKITAFKKDSRNNIYDQNISLKELERDYGLEDHFLSHEPDENSKRQPVKKTDIIDEESEHNSSQKDETMIDFSKSAIMKIDTLGRSETELDSVKIKPDYTKPVKSSIVKLGSQEKSNNIKRETYIQGDCLEVDVSKKNQVTITINDEQNFSVEPKQDILRTKKNMEDDFYPTGPFSLKDDEIDERGTFNGNPLKVEDEDLPLTKPKKLVNEKNTDEASNNKPLANDTNTDKAIKNNNIMETHTAMGIFYKKKSYRKINKEFIKTMQYNPLQAKLKLVPKMNHLKKHYPILNQHNVKQFTEMNYLYNDFDINDFKLDKKSLYSKQLGLSKKASTNPKDADKLQDKISCFTNTKEISFHKKYKFQKTNPNTAPGMDTLTRKFPKSNKLLNTIKFFRSKMNKSNLDPNNQDIYRNDYYYNCDTSHFRKLNTPNEAQLYTKSSSNNNYNQIMFKGSSTTDSYNKKSNSVGVANRPVYPNLALGKIQNKNHKKKRQNQTARDGSMIDRIAADEKSPGVKTDRIFSKTGNKAVDDMMKTQRNYNLKKIIHKSISGRGSMELSSVPANNNKGKNPLMTPQNFKEKNPKSKNRSSSNVSVNIFDDGDSIFDRVGIDMAENGLSDQDENKLNDQDEDQDLKSEASQKGDCLVANSNFKKKRDSIKTKENLLDSEKKSGLELLEITARVGHRKFKLDKKDHNRVRDITDPSDPRNLSVINKGIKNDFELVGRTPYVKMHPFSLVKKIIEKNVSEDHFGV